MAEGGGKGPICLPEASLEQIGKELPLFVIFCQSLDDGQREITRLRELSPCETKEAGEIFMG